ncbi:MAG: C4-dicarboxylate ABC transporter [Deltaproteobacteria bacterium]|nr:C4-dicarboxylate ABC transporter [Deltaproteobacteria bacterium]
MSNRAALLAVITAFSFGLLISLAVRPAADQSSAPGSSSIAQIRWRLPVAFNTNLPVLGENSAWVSETIASLSNDRFVLEVFQPGELVSPLEIVDAVRGDKVKAGYTWLGYDQGKLPVSVLFGAVPFGFEPVVFSAWWYDGGGQQLAQEIYRPLGIEPILCGLIGPEPAGWFREPLRNPEDLVGLKIRFAGLGGQVIQGLGASVTLLPGGEIFQALERGAIDATEFSLPVVDQQLGFNRVAQYNYFPGWHQPFTASHLAVNLAAWQSLSSQDQAILKTACTAGVTRNLAQAEATQAPTLALYEAEGIHTEVIPAPILAALEAETRLVLEHEAQRDADFARVLASQRAFGKDYDTWRKLAYPAKP